jgi:hypothetical protein
MPGATGVAVRGTEALKRLLVDSLRVFLLFLLKIPKGSPCYSAFEEIIPTRADVDNTNDTTNVALGTKRYARMNAKDTHNPVHQLQLIR